jgi:hypothetical protein
VMLDEPRRLAFLGSFYRPLFSRVSIEIGNKNHGRGMNY